MYFSKCACIEDLKTLYKKLAFQNHPDRGGDEEVMKAINNEYEKAFQRLKNVHKNAEGETYEKSAENGTTETPESYINIINELISMDGVIIEIVGTFIWLTGNTIQYKDRIKSLGFRWSKNKIAWYMPPEGYHKFGKKSYGLDQIREMYGSKVVNTSKKDFACLAE